MKPLLNSIPLTTFVWDSTFDVSVIIEPLLNSILLTSFVRGSHTDVAVSIEQLLNTFFLPFGVLLSFNLYIPVGVVFNVGCEFVVHGFEFMV